MNNPKNPRNAGRKEIDKSLLRKTLSVRLPVSLIKKIKDSISNSGMTQTEFIESACAEKLDDNKPR